MQRVIVIARHIGGFNGEVRAYGPFDDLATAQTYAEANSLDRWWTVDLIESLSVN